MNRDDIERALESYGTVPRRHPHAERLLDFKPVLAEELKGKPCVTCGDPRGVHGLSGAECGKCAGRSAS